MELKSQEAQGLQEQRDQYLGHLQQYVAAYQQLATEKDELQKQFLLQTQLMDRLQHEEVQGKVAADLARQELLQTQVRGLLVPFTRGRRWEAQRVTSSLPPNRHAWRLLPKKISSCRPSSALLQNPGKVRGSYTPSKRWQKGDIS